MNWKLFGKAAGVTVLGLSVAYTATDLTKSLLNEPEKIEKKVDFRSQRSRPKRPRRKKPSFLIPERYGFIIQTRSKVEMNSGTKVYEGERTDLYFAPVDDDGRALMITGEDGRPIPKRYKLKLVNRDPSRESRLWRTVKHVNEPHFVMVRESEARRRPISGGEHPFPVYGHKNKETGELEIIVTDPDYLVLVDFWNHVRKRGDPLQRRGLRKRYPTTMNQQGEMEYLEKIEKEASEGLDAFKKRKGYIDLEVTKSYFEGIKEEIERSVREGFPE